LQHTNITEKKSMSCDTHEMLNFPLFARLCILNICKDWSSQLLKYNPNTQTTGLKYSKVATTSIWCCYLALLL